MTRVARGAFLALIAAQACHSIEEYAGRMYDVFPPAAFVSGVFSADRRAGFVIANCLLVGFGLWCWLVPVRRGWPSARALGWFWAALETANAAAHATWALAARAYRPGLATAPLLLAAALALARALRRSDRTPSATTA